MTKKHQQSKLKINKQSNSLSYRSPSSLTRKRAGSDSDSAQSTADEASSPAIKPILQRNVWQRAKSDMQAFEHRAAKDLSSDDEVEPRLASAPEVDTTTDESDDSDSDTSELEEDSSGKTPDGNKNGTASSSRRPKRIIESEDDDQGDGSPVPRLPSLPLTPLRSPRKPLPTNPASASRTSARTASRDSTPELVIFKVTRSSPSKSTTNTKSKKKKQAKVDAPTSTNRKGKNRMIILSDSDEDVRRKNKQRDGEEDVEIYAFDLEAEEASDSTSGSSEPRFRSEQRRKREKQKNRDEEHRNRNAPEIQRNKRRNAPYSGSEDDEDLPDPSAVGAAVERTRHRSSSKPERKQAHQTISDDSDLDSEGQLRVPSSLIRKKKKAPLPYTVAKLKQVTRKANKRVRNDSVDDSERDSNDAFIADDYDDYAERKSHKNRKAARISSRAKGKNKEKTRAKESKRDRKRRRRAVSSTDEGSTSPSSDSSSSETDATPNGSDETNSEDEDDLELSGKETVLPEEKRRREKKANGFDRLRAERQHKSQGSAQRNPNNVIVISDDEEPEQQPKSSARVKPTRTYLGASSEEEQEGDGEEDESVIVDEAEPSGDDSATDLDADEVSFIVDEEDEDEDEEGRKLVEDLRRQVVGKSQGRTYYLKGFISWLARSLVAPEVDWLEDSDMRDAFEKVMNMYQGVLNSLLASSAWKPIFKAAIHSRPELALYPVEGPKDAACDACTMGNRRISSFVAVLRGSPYHPRKLTPLKSKARKKLLRKLELQDDNHDEDALQILVDPDQTLEFNLGRFCGDRSLTYHQLYHAPYAARLEVVKRLRAIHQPVDRTAGLSDRELEKRVAREAERCVEELEKVNMIRDLAYQMAQQVDETKKMFATSR